MAPKRHRGEGSSSRPTYDNRRFMSEEASDFFHDMLLNKKLIPERGFIPGIRDGKLLANIDKRKWGTFTAQPEPSVISVVKEFYANAKFVKHHEVKVRQKVVSFAPEAINAYYRLDQMVDGDAYVPYKEKADLDEIVQILCQPDSSWKIQDGKQVHFSYSTLSRYGKAWYYFLCAKLMPTTHVTEVIKDRAILLYCLVQGLSINVGNVIAASIKQAARAGTSRGLPHPSLICGLCELAGVEWADNEPLQDPQVLIDSKIIRNLKQWDGAPANLTGAGFILEATSPDTEELFAASPSPDPDSVFPLARNPEPSGPSPAHNATMEKLNKKLRRMVQHTDAQNLCLAQRQDAIHSFNVDVARALAQAFPAIPFPEATTLPHYPPPSPQSESED